MAFHVQGPSKHCCTLLAVLCGTQSSSSPEKDSKYPFPELVASGRLEVQVLSNPRIEELRKGIDSVRPNIVYFQGEDLRDDVVGSLKWAGANSSIVDDVVGLFDTTVPTTVYLEIPNGEKLAEALQAKGIPYVIYWKNKFTCFAACLFRHSLFSVVQSSSCHTWDAFRLAFASFRLYCVRNDLVLPANSPRSNNDLGPLLLGDPPKVNVSPPERSGVDDEETLHDSVPAIKIYDTDVTMKFLVCGMVQELDDILLGSLVDGLSALLNIEIRGSKLHNRVSALPPPLEAGSFSRGLVTMRCDLSTCTSAHISLLVSGSAETCFDDQRLENHIKNEITENVELLHSLTKCEESRQCLSEPRRSASIACGASVFEVCLKVPTWASQVLRQLAQDASYRCLVALGIAGVHGLAVASFENNDAERFLFFCSRQMKHNSSSDGSSLALPSWFKPPAPSRKRPALETSTSSHNGFISQNQPVFKIEDEENKDTKLRNTLRVAAMRPIPHIRHQKMLPFSAITDANGHDGGGQIKSSFPSVTPLSNRSSAGPNSGTQRKSHVNSFQAKQLISLNPLPLKKHGCNRSPIHVCSEEEFLKDVMEFLILRGHNRLIPQGGLAEFPDAILNATRLDLFNLYREVVSRGGFHVGNGINWKGQVFSKMRNHTATNRMTGVGNTLKRHYETYLLEYELAHDDVDGECCLLCRSSEAGDWVNCGMCGEWAHFGCDRRQGLGAFKDYAKTDGLEYVCPQCSVSNFKKKLQKSTNGYS